jgi:hypothetical protein
MASDTVTQLVRFVTHIPNIAVTVLTIRASSKTTLNSEVLVNGFRRLNRDYSVNFEAKNLE